MPAHGRRLVLAHSVQRSMVHMDRWMHVVAEGAQRCNALSGGRHAVCEISLGCNLDAWPRAVTAAGLTGAPVRLGGSPHSAACPALAFPLTYKSRLQAISVHTRARHCTATEDANPRQVCGALAPLSGLMLCYGRLARRFKTAAGPRGAARREQARADWPLPRGPGPFEQYSC